MKNHSKTYTEHKGTVVERGRFNHVMAITLNPKNNDEGLIRVIVSREGDLEIKGYIDKSALYKIKSINGLEKYEITTPLKIKGEEELIEKLNDSEHHYLGLEDPDLVVDEKGIFHLYFTIPLIKNKKTDDNIILLGHAFGKDLDSLEMTDPVLDQSQVGNGRAKELSLAPISSKGVRLNLVEARDRIDGVSYSTVRLAIAKGFSPRWKFGKTVLHPAKNGYSWCGGHASPGPLMPKEFINIGKNKLVGFMNGREADRKSGGETLYGMFSVGIFVYDYEKGEMDWLSKEPLIIDSEASTITFASQFVQTSDNEGILYAHVDDSFVRAYTIYADGIKSLLNGN